MGIVTVTVDDKEPATVDLYAQRNERDALVYATPTLPNGEHSLTVINTGLLDSQELHAGPPKPTRPRPDGPGKPDQTSHVTSDAVMIVPNSANVSTDNVVTNGDFETGNLTPWYGQWNPGLAGVETTYLDQGTHDAYLHPNGG